MGSIPALSFPSCGKNVGAAQEHTPAPSRLRRSPLSLIASSLVLLYCTYHFKIPQTVLSHQIEAQTNE